MTDNKGLHLWEVDHPYYCEEGNYFRSGTIGRYNSWEDFLEEEGEADPDYNLLFRWDWKNKDELWLYWMGQRKGLYRSTGILVKKSDEPSIRKWLNERLKHLLSVWTPIGADVPVPEPVPLPEPSEPFRIEYDLSDRSCGFCECHVPVYQFEKDYLCEFCAGTVAGALLKYPNQYPYSFQRHIKAIAVAVNTIRDTMTQEQFLALVSTCSNVRSIAEAQKVEWDTYRIHLRHRTRTAVLIALSGRRGTRDPASLEDIFQAINGVNGTAMTRDTEQAVMDLLFEGKLQLSLTPKAEEEAWKLRRQQ